MTNYYCSSNFVPMQVNNELCQLMGVKCNITSAYHPQSNGLDERFNQTLQRQLLKCVSEKENDWDLYLDAILFSYRVRFHQSIPIPTCIWPTA